MITLEGVTCKQKIAGEQNGRNQSAFYTIMVLRLIESLELLSNQKSFVLGIANARQKLWLLLHLKSLKIKTTNFITG